MENAKPMRFPANSISVGPIALRALQNRGSDAFAGRLLSGKRGNWCSGAEARSLRMPLAARLKPSPFKARRCCWMTRNCGSSGRIARA